MNDQLPRRRALRRERSGSTGGATTTRSGLLTVPRYVMAALRRRGPSAPPVPPSPRPTSSAASTAPPSRTRSRSRWSRPGPGVPASELSPAVADKIPSGIAQTVGLTRRGPAHPPGGRDRVRPRGAVERQRLARLPRARDLDGVREPRRRGRRLDPAQQPGRAHHRERRPGGRGPGRRPAGRRGRGREHRADQRAPPPGRGHRRARAVPRVPVPPDGVRQPAARRAGT